MSNRNETTHLIFRDKACNSRVGRIGQDKSGKYIPVVFSRWHPELSDKSADVVAQNVADLLQIKIYYAPME